MTRRLLHHVLLIVAASTAVAGPDEEFAAVVKRIQHGDQLVEQGQDRLAMDEFRKAQETLLNFNKVYPDWDRQVVSFRLRYLGERLGNWTGPKSSTSDSQEAETEALRSRISFLERASQQYQAQINQLVGDNNRLSGQLREALAIRPAAENPALLADTRAELEKVSAANSKLTNRVQELEKRWATIPNPDEAKKNARLVAELRENLNRALADAETLRKQNSTLREEARKTTAVAAKAEAADAAAEQQVSVRVTESAAEIEIKRLRSEIEQLQTQLTEAKKSLTTVNAAASRSSGAFRPADRARLALAEKHDDEAIEILSAELKTKPDDTEGWYLMGIARLAKEQFGEAESALKKAIALKPDLGTAHAELARLYLQRRPPDPALARWHYHKAIELNCPRDESLERALDWEQPGSAH